MDEPVAPAGILPGQAQYQQADGADGARSARAPGPGPGRMPTAQQVRVPAQHRLRLHQQPEPAQYIPRQPVQQGGQERAVATGEPRPGNAQLLLQDSDLVAQRQDLRACVACSCDTSSRPACGARRGASQVSQGRLRPSGYEV